MRKRILVADDSVTIQKVVELTFMEEQYELISAEDGRKAVAELEADAPDLVVADVHMPEVNGFELCRETKRRYPEVPVLLLVGAFEPFDPGDAEACGADGFLKKPFDSQDLLRRVDDLISKDAMHTSLAGSDEVDVSPPPSSTDGLEAEEYEVNQDSTEATSMPELSDEMVEKIAKRVVELLSPDALREVAWEVIPDMAEAVVRDRLRELESQVE